jgi:hypothetical protein
MSDSASKGMDFMAKAEKKLKGMSFFGNKYEEAVELLEKAANNFKMAKMCTRTRAPWAGRGRGAARRGESASGAGRGGVREGGGVGTGPLCVRETEGV